MQNDTAQQAQSNEDIAQGSEDPSKATRFESPSIEEISLCCEISAYAPDGDDRPLF